MYEERQQRRSTGALAEPLHIYFTILHCCKTKRERGRERRGKKNLSSILFSTLRRATSGSVTLHLHRTISLAKVHKTTKYLVTYCLTCSAEWLRGGEEEEEGKGCRGKERRGEIWKWNNHEGALLCREELGWISSYSCLLQTSDTFADMDSCFYVFYFPLTGFESLKSYSVSSCLNSSKSWYLWNI